MKWILSVFAAVMILLALRGCGVKRPASPLPEIPGRVAACPGPPRCVSSADERPGRHVEPLVWAGTPEDFTVAAREVLATFPGVEIVRSEPGFVHALFRTRWLRFIDDVELALDESAGLVHVRSSSRIGYYDFGVNRRRIERIRLALATRG